MVVFFFSDYQIPTFATNFLAMLSKSREELLILLLALVNFTNIIDFMVLMPLGPQINRVFHLDPQSWSMLVASYSLAAAFSGVASVFYIDKIDRKKMLLLSYIGFTVATLVCGLSHTHTMLLIARGLAGVFGGISGAIILTIVGDVVAPERRGRAVGIVMAGFSTAAALGVPIGIYFGAKFGWNMPFLAVSALSCLVTVLLIIYVPSVNGHLAKTKEERIKTWDVLTALAKDPNVRNALVFSSLLVFGQFMIIPFVSPYLVANLGFSEQDLTYLYLFGGGASIFTSPLIGKLADRYGKYKVLLIVSFISFIPILLLTHLHTTSILVVLLVTTTFFIFSGGRNVPAMALTVSVAKPEMRGVYMSVRSGIQQLVSALAAIVSGSMVTKGINGDFENYNYVGILSVVIAGLALWVGKSIKSNY